MSAKLQAYQELLKVAMEYNHRKLMEAREERKGLQKRNWMIAGINSLDVKVHNTCYSTNIVFVYML